MAFIEAARTNAGIQPKHGIKIALKLEALQSLRKWYFRQPEAVVQIDALQFLRAKSRSESVAMASVERGYQVRVISGPHGSGKWYRCKILSSSRHSDGGCVGFLRLTESELGHPHGFDCLDNVMDGVPYGESAESPEDIKPKSLEESQINSLLDHLAESSTNVPPDAVRESLLKASKMLDLIAKNNADQTSSMYSMVDALNADVKLLKDELSKERESNKKALESFEADKYALEADRIVRTIKINELNGENAKLQEEIDELRAEVASVNRKLVGESNAHDDVENQLADLSHRHEKTCESLAHELFNSSRLMEAIGQKEENIAFLQGAVAALRIELNESEHKYDGIKSDISESAWRVAGSQLVKLARDPISALIMRHLGDEDEGLRAKLGLFMKTEFGYALIASMMSIAVGTLGDTDATRSLSRELKVSAMSEASDAMLDVFIEPIRRIISSAISENHAKDNIKTLPTPESVIDFRDILTSKKESENVR